MYEFVRSKTQIVQDSRYSIARKLYSHIQHTCGIMCNELPELSPTQMDYFDKRKDVSISPLNWEIPVDPPNSMVREQISSQMRNINWQFKTFMRIGNLHEEIQCHTYMPHDPMQKLVCSCMTQMVQHKLAVIADKDPKRRVIMDPIGYAYRLLQGFLGDPSFYKMQENMSKQDVADIRNELAKRHLPKRIGQRNLFLADNVQYGYHTYKTKCLGIEGGLTCTRDHAHEREIISDAKNPHKTFFKSIARSI